MIMGDQCTRNCRFCAVQNGIIEPLDVQEPSRVADAVAALNLKYAVITSVTRDDLDDGGAFHFAQTIQAVRKAAPECKIEVLVPDLKGSAVALQTIIQAGPDVLNHNVETVPRLYHSVRPQAVYSRSLMLLQRAAEQNMMTKSGLMVGLGETTEEVHEVMNDLLQVNCRMLTIGQYLQPTIQHLAVVRYVDPEEFSQFKKHGLASGFKHIEAGPLVRSSYHADHQYGSL